MDNLKISKDIIHLTTSEFTKRSGHEFDVKYTNPILLYTADYKCTVCNITISVSAIINIRKILVHMDHPYRRHLYDFDPIENRNNNFSKYIEFLKNKVIIPSCEEYMIESILS